MTIAAPVAASDALIAYQNIGKSFWSQGREVVALREVNLEVRPNEFTAVVGPSGCGKTTLLRLCSGLESASSGLTLYKGKPVLSVNTDVGYVTQESNLYPW